jgi:hypothetical protein
MGETSARFGLPFLLPGQAQKEAYHNEALASIDATLHPSVEDKLRNDPPASPGEGESWIIVAAPTAAWATRATELATWTGGGWRFTAPVPGMMVWNQLSGWWVYWDGSAWSDGSLPATALRVGGQQVVGERQATVPSPSGGTVIDAEARSAIDGLIATLKSHGLID